MGNTIYNKFDRIKKDLFNIMPEFLKRNIEIIPNIIIRYNGEVILDTADDGLYPFYVYGIFYYRYELADKFDDYIQLNHNKSAEDDDIYMRLFTLLDKRTGKRTLRKYRDNGDFLKSIESGNYTLEKLYRIRFENANISVDENMIELLKAVRESE